MEMVGMLMKVEWRKKKRCKLQIENGGAGPNVILPSLERGDTGGESRNKQVPPRTASKFYSFINTFHRAYLHSTIKVAPIAQHFIKHIVNISNGEHQEDPPRIACLQEQDSCRKLCPGILGLSFPRGFDSSAQEG